MQGIAKDAMRLDLAGFPDSVKSCVTAAIAREELAHAKAPPELVSWWDDRFSVRTHHSFDLRSIRYILGVYSDFSRAACTAVERREWVGATTGPFGDVRAFEWSGERLLIGAEDFLERLIHHVYHVKEQTQHSDREDRSSECGRCVKDRPEYAKALHRHLTRQRRTLQVAAAASDASRPTPTTASEANSESAELAPEDAADRRSTLAKTLEHYRLESGWTYEKLAEKVGISKGGAINHIKGRATPHKRVLEKYARAFSSKFGRPITVNHLEDGNLI